MGRWAEAAARSARTLEDPGLRALTAGPRLLRWPTTRAARRPPRRRARAGADGLDALPDEELAARADLPYYLGFAEYFCERYADAARHFRRGLAVARVVGHGRFVVFMMTGLAQALERLGRLGEAQATAESAVEAARLSGNRQAVGFALVAAAWTAAEVGDVELARASAEEAVARLEGLDESVLTRATHAHVGVIWLEIGEPARCVEQLRVAGLPDFPQIEPGRRGWLYAVLARAELARGDPAAAAHWAARSEATVRGRGCRWPRPGRCTRGHSSRSPAATRPRRCGSPYRPPGARTRSRRPCRRRAAGRSRASRRRRRATARPRTASSPVPRMSSRPAARSATATRRPGRCAGWATG